MSETCPHCGAGLNEGDWLCPVCNLEFDRATAAGEPATEPTHGASGEVGADLSAALLADGWMCTGPDCHERHAPDEEECMWCQTRRPERAPQSEPAPTAGADEPLRLRGNGVVIDLCGAGPWEVGRDALGADVLSGALGVSRHHLRIERSADNLLVTDLGSSNGTFVNDQKIPDRHTVPLPRGARLGLGRAVTLQLDHSEARR